MFTGLVQEVGTIEALAPQGGTVRITVAAPGLAPSLKPGDSIAVSGVCLTALSPEPSRFHAELAEETVQRTSLAGLKPNVQVNLELPTPAGAPLGGHIVQGHVDATGVLLALERVASGERSDWLLRVRVPAQVGRFVVEKGSITIEGISLTVARWLPDGDGAGELQVAVIPHTYEATNLHSLGVGAPVNLEADVLMKLAVQNGLGAPGASGWSKLGDELTRGTAGFEVTIAYLVANGY